MFYDLSLQQLISEPTHIAGNTLDLLLCNQTNIISDIEVMPRGSICSSPHYSIKFKVKLQYKRLKVSKRKAYNFKKANFKLLNDELMRFPWDSILIGDDVDSMLNKFEVAFFSICDRHIPKVTIKSSFQPPWFDSELDAICKHKNKLLTKYRKAGNEQLKHNIYEEIKSVRNKFRKLSTQKKRDNLLNDDVDPALIKKKVWSFLKQPQIAAAYQKQYVMELNLDQKTLIWRIYLTNIFLTSFLAQVHTILI